jgi:hypothetical protein
MSRYIPFLALVVFLTSADRFPSQAAPFVCPPPYVPFRQEFAQATFVLEGTLVNPAMNPVGDTKNAVTSVRILSVVKNDPVIANGTVITLPRFIEVPDPKKPPRMLIFFDVFKGKVDPYRGIFINSDALPKYIMEAVKLDPKKPGAALHFFQRHLDSPCPEVVQDASAELSDLPYEEIRRHAASLPADAIAARLKSEKTPNSLRNFDGLLLGHCGSVKHATLLETLIEARRKQRDDKGLQGLLVGYTLLRPKEGLAQVRKVASQGKEEFMLRYQALKALRFLGRERPDVLPRAQLIEASCLMLEQPDIADLIIEDMRRLAEGSILDRVLSLYGKKEFDIPIIRRAIIRFALTLSKNPKAAQFVEERRAEDPEGVEAVEEALKLER